MFTCLIAVLDTKNPDFNPEALYLETFIIDVVLIVNIFGAFL